MIFATPALVARILEVNQSAEEALAGALIDTAAVEPGKARVAAAAIVAVLWALARENHGSVASGPSAADVFPQARGADEEAFQLLESGFGELGEG